MLETEPTEEIENIFKHIWLKMMTSTLKTVNVKEMDTRQQPQESITNLSNL